MYCIVKVVYLYCESESGKLIIRLKNKVSGAKIDSYLGIMVIGHFRYIKIQLDGEA